jgi:hypothetical protein
MMEIVFMAIQVGGARKCKSFVLKLLNFGELSLLHKKVVAKPVLETR